MKIHYLFTTFPVLSETFLQREIRVMRDAGHELTLHSIWGGELEFEGQPVRRMHLTELLKLFVELPYWLVRKPAALREIFEKLWDKGPPSLLNVAEVMLGLGYGIIKARQFAHEQPHLLHAVWATMPSTAALVLHQLTGIPFSMGAHAYDVFRDGGDWLLPEKLKAARLIHTTTRATQRALLFHGAAPLRLVLIRRGLDRLPVMKPLRADRRPIQIISVGRLVPKKGYFYQLEIYRALAEKGLKFQATIIGGGNLLGELEKQTLELGLSEHVKFTGAIAFDAVQSHYEGADLFLFTGIVAPDGDRDGLPNVIPEAMAYGLPVITAPVSGTIEAITDRKTGFVCPLETPGEWVKIISQLQNNDSLYEQIRTAARQWVETEFNARQNTLRLAKCMQEALAPEPHH